MTEKKTPYEYLTDTYDIAAKKLDPGKLGVYRRALSEANTLYTGNDLRYVTEYLCQSIIILERELPGGKTVGRRS